VGGKRERNEMTFRKLDWEGRAEEMSKAEAV
jgi:hypothetical protein